MSKFTTVLVHGTPVEVELKDSGSRIAYLCGCYLALDEKGRQSATNLNDDSGLYMQLLSAISAARF